MAKQTFTTGQVLTAAQMLSLQQTAMLGGAANAKVASYVLVAADAGDAITMSNASPTTITVNTGLFAAGDIVTIINLGAGACTITAGTATVDTSGSLVLATNQGGVLRFTSASAAIFFQFATPASGDIEGVTAGTGISGGGTSGTVTITNSMATAIDAKGDLIVGTGADTFDRLAAGTTGYTLVADSAAATGLKWAAPAAGGGMTLLQSLSLSGASVTSSTFTPADYVSYYIVLEGIYLSNPNSDFNIRLNTDTGSNYYRSRINLNDTTFAGSRATGATSFGIGSLGAISGAGQKASGSIQINRINDTTEVGIQSWLYSSLSTEGDVRIQITMGTYNNSAAISSITFIGATNDFAAGTAYIYGVK
jgi:hypothetical protein